MEGEDSAAAASTCLKSSGITSQFSHHVHYVLIFLKLNEFQMADILRLLEIFIPRISVHLKATIRLLLIFHAHFPTSIHLPLRTLLLEELSDLSYLVFGNYS